MQVDSIQYVEIVEPCLYVYMHALVGWDSARHRITVHVMILSSFSVQLKLE
jgi:hypothetical protein